MIDWDLYRDHFSAADMREIWSEQATIAQWLHVEQTLARHQARLGLIEPSVAEALAAVGVEDLDREKLRDEMALAGRPIIGLVKQLREQVPEGQRHLVHFGTTTQDILDTACSLQMKTGLQWLDAKLAGILAAIDSLAADCRGCQGIARTNGQYAMPIQLTQKFAVWRQELQRRRRALVDVGKTNLWLQLAGPVGDHSGFGAKAEQLRTGMARELGLSLVSPHWQNARDGIAEIIASLGLLAASITKIAHNINLLSSSDIGEYRERQTPGKGNSSTMPHKRNQRCSEFAEATARLARQHAEQINESGLHQHERSGGAWISEWYIVPQVFLLSSAAVMWTERLFTSLEINEQQIAENLARFQQG